MAGRTRQAAGGGAVKPNLRRLRGVHKAPHHIGVGDVTRGGGGGGGDVAFTVTLVAFTPVALTLVNSSVVSSVDIAVVWCAPPVPCYAWAEIHVNHDAHHDEHRRSPACVGQTPHVPLPVIAEAEAWRVRSRARLDGVERRFRVCRGVRARGRACRCFQ